MALITDISSCSVSYWSRFAAKYFFHAIAISTWDSTGDSKIQNANKTVCVRDGAAKNTGMPDVIPTLRNIKCFLYGVGRGLFTHVTKLPCKEEEEKKKEKNEALRK